MNTTVHTTETGTDNPDPKAGRRVQKRASLHEKAVQDIASGTTRPQPRRLREGRLRPDKSALVPERRPSTAVHTHITLDARVLKVVKEILADSSNSYTVFEILDHETARVR